MRHKPILHRTASATRTELCALCLLWTLCLPTGCERQLDIVPKGKVTLSTVGELELLLNQEYQVGELPANDLGIVCGETLGMFDQVSSVLSQKNTCKYAYMAYDESVDRATLTPSDDRYNSLYQYINYMNTVVNMMDEATGDEGRKPSLVAEARVMRAYLHWLAVGIYARQYDPATAAEQGGIAYVTSTEVTEEKTKLSLAEVYDRILRDVSDEVIAQLPADRGNMVMRGDRAWGNAVRAVVLLQMKRYAEALPYAQEAIRLRPQMFDRSAIKATGTWTQDQSTPNNFLYMGGAGIRVSPTTAMLTLETATLFEPGDYVRLYDTPSGWDAAYGKSYSGLDGVLMYMGWSAQCNVYGLTSEQLRYVAAECLIRTGRTTEGLALVDQVRALRVENYEPFATRGITDEAEAMSLLQRAKWIECLATPFNYLDVKRWNSEPAYARTVSHRLGTNGTYRLSPTSPLWVMPFPANAIRYNKSLSQNY